MTRKATCGRIFNSMPNFWSYMRMLVNDLPTADALLQSGNRIRAGNLEFDRCPSLPTDSDVANLDDLESFDLPDDD